MTSKEKMEKAWELVNSKHIETNDEIQLVRYAVRMARDLVERDTPMKVLRVDDGGMRVKGYNHHSPYCPSCNNRIYNESFNREKHNTNFCPKCGQRLDWSERK